MMPPSPRGSVQEQLVRQYSYLFQMAQQLNVALGQLESGGTAASSGGTAAPAAEREQQYQTLKSMIVKTADTVQRRMDQLSTKLMGEYVAASEFGTYVERLNAYLEANPEALTQYYSFFADLQAKQSSDSFFRQGYREGQQLPFLSCLTFPSFLSPFRYFLMYFVYLKEYSPGKRFMLP